MPEDWEYQVRINVSDDYSEILRRDLGDPAVKPIADILSKHRATLKSQYDAFADYVSEAEKRGVEHFPLYKWTKATIETPSKRRSTVNPLPFMSKAKRCTPSRRPTRLRRIYCLLSAPARLRKCRNTTPIPQTTLRPRRIFAERKDLAAAGRHRISCSTSPVGSRPPFSWQFASPKCRIRRLGERAGARTRDPLIKSLLYAILCVSMGYAPLQ